MLDNDVILQVGNHTAHVIATDIDSGKVDGRISQAEDVGTATTRGLHLAQIGHDILLDQLLNELRDGGHADMELFRKLGERTLAIYGHVGNDAALNNAVLVGYTLDDIVIVFNEKFGK